MKKIKIKVEIKAEVPEGKYCYDIENEIHCSELKEDYEPIQYLSKSICSFFHKKHLEETLDKQGKALIVLKCQACLDACKVAQKR